LPSVVISWYICCRVALYRIASLSVLGIGLIFSAIATSSCKFVKRGLADDYVAYYGIDDDELIDGNQFGLFSWYDEEKCSTDYGSYDFDVAEKFAQAAGVIAPLFAGITFIIKAFALFFVFPRGLNVTVAVLSSIVVFFQLGVFAIYGGTQCSGPFVEEYYDDDDFEYGSAGPRLESVCEPDEGSYLASIAFILFLSSAIMACCTPRSDKAPIDCSGCCGMPDAIELTATPPHGVPQNVRVITRETIHPDGSKTIETIHEPII